ncbi:MAG: DsbE family thiol:disulfide interchange protein [Magnetococcus sp. DMHC-6]
MKSLWKVVLLAGITGILILFALGLGKDPRNIPSPLIGQPASPFTAKSLDGKGDVSLSDYRGKWVLVNFWGSWCVSCIAEHPYLIELASKARMRSDFALVGVDFRDTEAGARNFFARHGDPGYRQALSPDQKIAIDWGVYGAPESFLVDPNGIVRLKHTGPLYPGWFETVALRLMVGGQK